MYEVSVSMRYTRFSGKCCWNKRKIVLYPMSLWRIVTQLEKTLFKPATGSQEFEDPFELLDPNAKIIYNEELVTSVKHNAFLTVLGKVLFHEYMHQFLKENDIHPWTCRRCKEGMCKLCNLTEDLLDIFWPETSYTASQQYGRHRV